ncbi:MAG: ester cyclase [Anaerolineaceae bacterium]|nr:ester cyclase [Anaerolineaceae bacterium]
MAMSREELHQITSQWISLWNAPGDWALFDQLHSDYFQDQSPAGRSNNKQAYAAALRELFEIFPDLTIQVDDMVIDVPAQRVAVRWSAEGTNRVKFLGVGPTNKKTPIAGIEIIEISEGKIIRRWGEWDISGHK